MIIRPAKIEDIKTLQNLNDEVFIDNKKYDTDLKLDWAQSEAGKKYFISAITSPNAVCLIAEEGNSAIGYIAAGLKEVEYRLSKYIEVENMGVLPEYRSKGIGSKLMSACLKIAKEKGYQRVYVNVYAKNEKAVKFYENEGFEKIDICLDKDI